MKNLLIFSVLAALLIGWIAAQVFGAPGAINWILLTVTLVLLPLSLRRLSQSRNRLLRRVSRHPRGRKS